MEKFDMKFAEIVNENIQARVKAEEESQSYEFETVVAMGVACLLCLILMQFTSF